MFTVVTKSELARAIDHTLLRPEATRADIARLCREAREYGFAAVCVNPFFVPLAAEQLAGTGVAVCTVIGFPLGSTFSAAKSCEAAEAVRRGARELDMVINVAALKERREDVVLDDIKAVVEAARSVEHNAVIKVIIETCYLTREEKVLACRLAEQAGAHFVKTSTGFGTGGATVEDVALLRAAVGQRLGVKASGGIKNAKQALAMLEAGATRIGASAGVEIVRELS